MPRLLPLPARSPRSIGSILVHALVLGGLACAAPALAEQREKGPEYRTHEEQALRASRTTDRAPVGRISPGASTLAANLSWEELGPRPIQFDYWANGNASGRVSAILVDPRDGDVAYVAAAQGGVWKTLDGGANWTPLTDGLSSLASGALAFDPRDPDVVYYGTGEFHSSGDSYYGDGLFRSDDAGASWTKIATRTAVGDYISRVSVHATKPETLYVSSSDGLLRSTNGGVSWVIVLGGFCYDMVFDPTDHDVIYAGIYAGGVHKSTNGGTSWTLLAGGLPPGGSIRRVNLAIAPSNPLVVYASLVAPNGSLYGMYKTVNGGTTWGALFSTPNYLGNQGWYDNCLIVDPGNENILMAGGVFPYGPGYAGVIRTTNGGGSWTDVTTGIDGSQVHPDQHALAYGPDGMLWLGNDGGVWKTADRGDHWINCNNNLAITQFYTVAVHPTDPDELLGGTQDNGTVRYVGTIDWPQVVSGDGGAVVYRADSPNLFYTTYVYLNPVFMFDDGSYLGDVTGPWAGRDAALFTESPMVPDPSAPMTMLAGTYRIWRTTNGGFTWDSLTTDLSGGGGVLASIAVGATGSNHIYAGTTNGRVMVTTDAVSWHNRSLGLPMATIRDIFVDPMDQMTAYICADAASGPRVFKTTNAGVNWTSATGNLMGNLPALSLAVDFALIPPTLYLGTDYGVYSSTDDGATWTKEAAGFPNCAVFDLAVDLDHGLVAATHGRGMWRGSRSLLAVDPSRPPAGAIELVAVNPTHAPARMEFRLATGRDVKLEIVDLAGRRVRSLASGRREAGRHALTWDGRDAAGATVSAGIYFARLAAGGESMARRITLLK